MAMNTDDQEIRDKMLQMMSAVEDDPLAIYERENNEIEDDKSEEEKETKPQTGLFEQTPDTPVVKLNPVIMETQAEKETYRDMIHRLQATKEELKKKKQVKYGELITPEITPEVKKDLQVMSMRGFIDSKSFFKGEKRVKKLPKKFEMGTVIEGRMDTNAQRLTRKERKSTILEQIMDNETVRRRAYQALLPKAKRAKKHRK